jgi:YkoY family integral membrane protein
MGQGLLIIFNLLLLEAMLSIDNVAVLALMVKDLPKGQQPKALRYGIFGAFAMRGLSLFCVSFLIKILWLKLLGGLYLLYLVYGHFTPNKDEMEEGVDKGGNQWYLGMKRRLGAFWATVILVEIMDMAFSIDNIFAATAMTDKINLILIGVFMGMIAMRFVAQFFCFLLVKFPSLEKSAFIVIGLLGIKLIAVSIVSWFPAYDALNGFVKSHSFDLSFSAGLLIVFFLPLLTTQKHSIHALHES